MRGRKFKAIILSFYFSKYGIVKSKFQASARGASGKRLVIYCKNIYQEKINMYGIHENMERSCSSRNANTIRSGYEFSIVASKRHGARLHGLQILLRADSLVLF